MEQRIENDYFIARVDAIFSESKIGDLKTKLRDIDEVKLQLAVAAIILESQGKIIETGVAIDGTEWQEIYFPITKEDKDEVEKIRQEIFKMHETKKAPECTCGWCERNEQETKSQTSPQPKEQQTHKGKN